MMPPLPTELPRIPPHLHREGEGLGVLRIPAQASLPLEADLPASRVLRQEKLAGPPVQPVRIQVPQAKALGESQREALLGSLTAARAWQPPPRATEPHPVEEKP